MEILSLDLKNFKIHQDRHFDFQPGTNAISGENGAGKTSILEAIAWVLFDYDSDYKRREDLIRNGTKAAEAKVTFVSSLDGEVYQVTRTASKSKKSSYQVFTGPPDVANLGLEKQEDVIQWLKLHLGVSPETKLADLFKNTIGIPQGTFTHDFLKSPEERKKVFDPILGVEDYKLAVNSSSRLATHALQQVDNLKKDIAHYDDLLQDWPEQKAQQHRVEQALAQTEKRQQQLHQDITKLDIELQNFLTLNQQIQAIQKQRDLLLGRIQAQTTAIEKQRVLVQRAETATTICEQNRTDFEAYLDAENKLQALRSQRTQKETLDRELAQQNSALNQVKITLAQLTTRLDAFQQHQTIVQVKTPLIEQQQHLEQQLDAIQQQLLELVTAKTEQKRLQAEQKQKTIKLSSLQSEIQQLQALEAQVTQIPALEAELSRYTQLLGRVGAAQQFEVELRQMVELGRTQGTDYTLQVKAIEQVLQEIQTAAPIFNSAVESALTVFQAGVTLTDTLLQQLEQILATLAAQTDEKHIRQQLQRLKTELESAQRANQRFATLAGKQEDATHLTEELQLLANRLQELTTQVAREPDLVQQQQHLVQQLEQLDNPRERCRLAQQQLQEQPQVQITFEQQQQQQRELEQTVQSLTQKLTPLEDVIKQIIALEAYQNQSKTGYQKSLAHQNEAATLAQRQQELAAIKTQLQALEAEAKELAQKQQELLQNYDTDRVEQLNQTREQKTIEKAQLEGSLPGQQQELQRLNTTLERYAQLAEDREQARQSLQHKEKISSFIQTARQVYKDAGPAVTKLFTKQISGEADRIFRELLNRQGVGLTWTEDYEILVQEAGNERSFRSLSGGEQMCAALAVRLALIRVLADIDIVFLDEPTTNMDETRRKLLAQAVANVTSFRQLFVISHDDTFETAADYVLFVEREV